MKLKLAFRTAPCTRTSAPRTHTHQHCSHGTRDILRAAPFLCVATVLRPHQAVRHARQAPARPDLPALRAPLEGARVHPGAAHLPGAAVGHQGLVRRRGLPHDGNGRPSVGCSSTSLTPLTPTPYDVGGGDRHGPPSRADMYCDSVNV